MTNFLPVEENDFAGLRSAASTLVSVLGLALARVWIRSAETDNGVAIACVASQGDVAGAGGMKPEAVAAALRAGVREPERTNSPQLDERFRGTLVAQSFVGSVLFRKSTPVAYLEAYSSTPIAPIPFTAARERLSAFLTSPEAASIPTGTVVLAEDDETTRSILGRMLRRHHYRVIDVENGQLACYAVRKEHPDLILLDWAMPVMDGREATIYLKTDPSTRSIPILMLTSHARIEDKIVALESGVQDFITKPFEENDLIARIDTHMRSRSRLGTAWQRKNDIPSAPSLEVAPGLTPSETEIPAGVVAAGDTVWLLATQAASAGNLGETVRLFMLEAEQCDGDGRHLRAAVAYRSASLAAAEQPNVPLANKLMMLAGNMFSSAADTGAAGSRPQSFVNAARCFLACGELRAAKDALEAAILAQESLA